MLLVDARVIAWGMRGGEGRGSDGRRGRLSAEDGWDYGSTGGDVSPRKVHIYSRKKVYGGSGECISESRKGERERGRHKQVDNKRISLFVARHQFYGANLPVVGEEFAALPKKYLCSMD